MIFILFEYVGFAPIPVNASSKSDLIPPREEPIVVSSEAVSEKRNQPVPLVSKNEKSNFFKIYFYTFF